jgi:hypothetical protein
VRRGSFANVEELQQAIMEFLAAWNEHPKPFVWTATVQMIQEKRARCRQTLEQIQPGCTQPRRSRPTKKLSSQFLDFGHYTSVCISWSDLGLRAYEMDLRPRLG